MFPLFPNVHVDTLYQKVLYNSCLFLFLRHGIQKVKEHILLKWGFIVFDWFYCAWFYSLYRNYFFEWKCDLFIYFRNIFYHVTLENIFRILYNSLYFENILCVTNPANAYQRHLVLSTDEPFSINRWWSHQNINNKKLWGINLNNSLGSDTYATNICNRVSKKLHALARISQFMNIHKRRMTMKAFIASEFGYCPLVWMFDNKKLSSRVNKLHERTL